MLNKAVLMGRLTRDPEVRYTQTQVPIANFSLAVDRSFVRQGEERQTDFINIVVFGKTAEFVQKYFTKGQLVAVAGRIQSRNWEDKDGNKRNTVEVVAEEVHFAEKKDSSSRSNSNSGSDSSDSDFAPTYDDDQLPF